MFGKNKLKKEIERLKEVISDKEKTIYSVTNFAERQIDNFKTRRLIVGSKGTGKTEFTKYLLSKMKNYFVIDQCDEYSFVGEENRINLSKNNSIPKMNYILEIIKKNKSKTMIIESSYFSECFMAKIIDCMLIENIDFVIVSQSIYSSLLKRKDSFDFIYDFGGCEAKRFVFDDNDPLTRLKFKEMNKSMFVKLP